MASYLHLPAPPPGFRAFRGLLARLGRRRDARTGSASDGSAHPDSLDAPFGPIHRGLFEMKGSFIDLGWMKEPFIVLTTRPSTANPARARHRDRRCYLP